MAGNYFGQLEKQALKKKKLVSIAALNMFESLKM